MTQQQYNNFGAAQKMYLLMVFFQGHDRDENDVLFKFVKMNYSIFLLPPNLPIAICCWITKDNSWLCKTQYMNRNETMRIKCSSICSTPLHLSPNIKCVESGVG
jgi:hypothetical protein